MIGAGRFGGTGRWRSVAAVVLAYALVFQALLAVPHAAMAPQAGILCVTGDGSGPMPGGRNDASPEMPCCLPACRGGIDLPAVRTSEPVLPRPLPAVAAARLDGPSPRAPPPLPAPRPLQPRAPPSVLA